MAHLSERKLCTKEAMSILTYLQQQHEYMDPVTEYTVLEPTANT